MESTSATGRRCRFAHAQRCRALARPSRLAKRAVTESHPVLTAAATRSYPILTIASGVPLAGRNQLAGYSAPLVLCQSLI